MPTGGTICRLAYSLIVGGVTYLQPV